MESSQIKNKPEPNVFLTAKCNGRCIYCSAKDEDREMTYEQAYEVISAGHNALVFEGGEPLLCRDLESWIKKAVELGVQDISILTNGYLLSKERLESLLKAGARHFHFNFPVHTKREHALLTGFPGLLERQKENIARAAAVSPRTVVLVCVINSVNYMLLPQYVRFVADNFPGIYYIALNFIKIKGNVKKRKFLIPRLSKAACYVRKALLEAKKHGIACIVDGIPLCLLDGCEAYSRDADHILRGDKTYLWEKASVNACTRCSLVSMCPGPRKDYVAVYGDSEFHSVEKDGKSISEKIFKGQLSLNS